nr:RodZ domain-containing protein [uncultured Haemophilus sp.]
MTESTPITSSSDTLSLGQQLKQAREALQLSIEAVAQKTNLKKSHLESLENDIFILQNVAPTFVRGYVRNYLRFLRLPEELANSVNYGEVKIPKEVMHKTSAGKVVQKSQNLWVKYLTIFVLLAAIGMTLLWWWQDYQQEQENRDQFVNNAVPVETTAMPANNIEITPQVVETKPATSVTQTIEQAVENAENVATQPTSSSAETTITNETPAVANVAENNTAENTAATATEVLVQPTAENSENAATATPEAAVNNDELRIEITGKESWITVKGAQSKKSLAEKLYSNGEVLTFNGNEQYRLTIGAPANVKIFYKGQEVPLKIDGRVARIKLPLAQ